MPIAKVQLPDGRIARFDVAEGTTPQEVEAFAHRHIADSSMWDKSKQIAKTVFNASPPGAAFNLVGAGTHALEKGADIAGGKVTDATGSPALGTAANVAIQALPMAIGGGTGAKVGGMIGEALTPAAERAARFFMQSALKPEKAARTSGKAAAAIDTLLDTGTLVSRGGSEKLEVAVDKLGKEISAALANNTGTVSKSTVANYLMPVYEKYLRQTNPSASIKVIHEEAKEFLDHVLLKAYGDKIPVQLAQEIKQGNYRVLGDKAYGMGLKPEAERDAKKALTRGLKEGVEDVSPQVKELNATQSSLLTAKKLVDNALMSSGNKNPLGLGWVAPTTERTLAWLMDRSPWLKSLVAQALHTAPGEVGLKGIGQVAGAAAGAATAPNIRNVDPQMQQPWNTGIP